MKNLLLPALGMIVALSSCGGSDSFSGEAPEPTAGPGLSSSDAVTAAAVSYRVTEASAAFANVGSGIGVPAGAPGSSAPRISRQQISGFLINALQAVPFGPDVVNCVVSGTITLSGDVVDPLTLTADDNFSIGANACDNGLGSVVDGQLDITIIDFSGDLLTGTYLVGMTATLDALQVTTANNVISSTGDATVALDTTGLPFVSASISGISMATSSNASTETLRNYSTVYSVDAGAVPSPYTLTSSGNVDSSRLSSSISYSTPVQFLGDGADYPHTGELLIMSSGATIRLTALDNTNVSISLDIDSDGNVDETTIITWAALTNPSSP